MKYFLWITFLFPVGFQAQESYDLILKKCRKELSKKICLSDEDEDGTLFFLDQCPKEKGPVENNGCPWPDSDGDGIVDKDDACPTVKGPAENNGCPWSDTDGDGILDKDDPYPTSPYKNGKDCKKIYQDEKDRYEKGIKEVENTDFSGLMDIIFEYPDFKKLAAQKQKIVLLKQFINSAGPQCGNDAYYDCEHYEKNIDSDVFNKVWNKDNFNKLRKKLGNKAIIPLAVSRGDFSFSFEDENDENNYFEFNKIKPYYKAKLNDNGIDRTIYYFAPQKPVKELVITFKDEKFTGIQYINMGISVLPFYGRNSNVEYLVQLIFSDEKGSEWRSKSIFYHYKDGKWSMDRVL